MAGAGDLGDAQQKRKFKPVEDMESFRKRPSSKKRREFKGHPACRRGGRRASSKDAGMDADGRGRPAKREETT